MDVFEPHAKDHIEFHAVLLEGIVTNYLIFPINYCRLVDENDANDTLQSRSFEVSAEHREALVPY